MSLWHLTENKEWSLLNLCSAVTYLKHHASLRASCCMSPPCDAAYFCPCLSPCFTVYGVELLLKTTGLGPVEYLSSGWNL